MVTELSTTPTDRKSALGQYLTPTPVAQFMAAMFGPLPRSVRLLDAGAGAGALTQALVERCCHSTDEVEEIQATLYEIDSEIIPELESTLAKCQVIAENANITFSFAIHRVDFITEVANQLSNALFSSDVGLYNTIILNPPYRKISSEGKERNALRSVGVESGNLYSAFLTLSIRLLTNDGQLVAITPRSFCNGPYFKNFRADFLSRTRIQWIHEISSRSTAFGHDQVVQENIIFLVKRSDSPNGTVSITTGETARIEVNAKRTYLRSEIIHPQDPEQFIHIPSNTKHVDARDRLTKLRSTLADLGFTVSTGRVVDFRLKEHLRRVSETGTVPLLYPCHFSKRELNWPQFSNKKPNAIVENDLTRSWLIPNATYILTKRFTAKEEQRRVVAYFLSSHALPTEWLGIENHLNYFHSHGKGLDSNLAKGLFLYLNSTVIDDFFRAFSGHTQVNATDLRNIPYPSITALHQLGAAMTSTTMDQSEIDDLMNSYLYG